MASANRSKAQRKGTPGSAGRAPAWSGARASPTFSPASNSPRLNQGSFSSVPQPTPNRLDNPPDRVLQSLAGLTGTTITLVTKTSQRYEGVVFSTNGEGDTTGVTLKDVRELTNPGSPLKDQFFIASTNIEKWSSGPADAKFSNGDTFRTDTDISQKNTGGGGGGEKELQAWQAPPDALVTSEGTQFARGDDVTFGPGSSGSTSWDQFTTNEKTIWYAYTTKLDRNAPEYKERAREAQKIADEILGVASNNPHVTEERNQAHDDSGINEEDKYGAVVRGTNAYIPPGARKATGLTNAIKADIPKPPADALPALREFVANEKQRLTEKRQALAKSEMDKRMADLVKFSQSFKYQRGGPHITTAKVVEPGRKPTASVVGTTKTTSQASGAATAVTQKTVANKTETTKPTKPMMFIQAIPPFKSGKRQSLQPAPSANGTGNGATATQAPVPTKAPGAPSPGPSTSNHSLSSSVSPKPKEPVPTTPNPFFGTRSIKKGPPVNVKDDFNPFKHSKVVEASNIVATWPYTGKRFMQLFPAPQHPPQTPHMVGPPPTMPPPPPYEEDPNQRAAAPGGYVYYAPTYYPGQPMMPGMAPPGPPGTFMPPYMQPMHYPPGMPPNAMYAPPAMGQMPPYMQAPLPGAYPPPPNGAGPRPSMPPTPIPAHAHPYYHQSPQIPYSMMMPPPGSIPHPYDGSAAPPVQMGGHA
ncbi:hypothetical protein J3R30DRAFT_3657703 [Lentinula aciculospora]|uniref:LsmAD domain-containing protein n=1 Tax=Lentinula aciculospora TaxID=153920 RepID=A0A9W9A8R9_9AGAR|nr:hypothetical protein J3R30DRAFT_3657703 [Lentinula aciculospora]